jgi:hypothetical protein
MTQIDADFLWGGTACRRPQSEALTKAKLIIGPLYLLPTRISLGKTQSRPIFTLNLLAGWTIIGNPALDIWHPTPLGIIYLTDATHSPIVRA